MLDGVGKVVHLPNEPSDDYFGFLLRGLGSIEWLVGRHISLLWLDRESKKNRWKIFSKNFFEGLLSCMAVEVGVAIEGQKSNFGSSFVIFGARSMNEGSLERA